MGPPCRIDKIADKFALSSALPAMRQIDRLYVVAIQLLTLHAAFAMMRQRSAPAVPMPSPASPRQNWQFAAVSRGAGKRIRRLRRDGIR